MVYLIAVYAALFSGWAGQLMLPVGGSVLTGSSLMVGFLIGYLTIVRYRFGSRMFWNVAEVMTATFLLNIFIFNRPLTWITFAGIGIWLLGCAVGYNWQNFARPFPMWVRIVFINTCVLSVYLVLLTLARVLGTDTPWTAALWTRFAIVEFAAAVAVPPLLFINKLWGKDENNTLNPGQRNSS